MEWKVGQSVQVQSRTWAGINKPGGCARITKVHYFDTSTDDDGNQNNSSKNIQGLDVKYVVGGGFEKNLDPNLVFHLETLQRGGRKRRGREFLMERVDDIRSKVCKSKQKQPEKKVKGKSAKQKDEAKKSTKRRLPLPIKKGGRTENEDPQSATLSPSEPSSPSAVSSSPPQPKSRRKVAKTLVPAKKKIVVAVASNNTKDAVKPMEVVFTDQCIEVSPLDRILARKQKKSPPEVRRGLFESRKQDSPTDQGEIAAAVQAAAFAVAPKANKVVAATSATSTATGSSKKQKKKQQYNKQMPQSTMGKQQSRQTTEAAVNDTPTQQQNPSVSRHQPLHHMAAKPPASYTPKLQMPRPPPKHAVKPGKSVPLKRVFENEMQKARQFIDDLIKPREEEEDLEEDKDDSQRQPSSPSRFVQFMTIFNRIRLRMDDGTIEEEDFLKQVNAEAIRAYDKNEINTFIDKLSEQGKVMKSDGNIYII
ncbi:unnamed protein product [Cylindrotheca closterium]|uniref:MCM3-like winged helix domain-containing protein n=1 Tax=Cylindrotheca closterium TaxID=2856 RepID=A0AAD2GA16_9STRA|nr:unnamed protein product [Cylindrotheca closterium]